MRIYDWLFSFYDAFLDTDSKIFSLMSLTVQTESAQSVWGNRRLSHSIILWDGVLAVRL